MAAKSSRCHEAASPLFALLTGILAAAALVGALTVAKGPAGAESRLAATGNSVGPVAVIAVAALLVAGVAFLVIGLRKGKKSDTPQ